MLKSADPAYCSFEAQSESGVRDGAVPAKIQVPLECLLREIVRFDALQQHVKVIFTLTAAYDLAVPFRGQHIDRQSNLWILGVALHIERLH
ncbi:MAG: hypothetical protein HW389_3807, partial [Bacteroidetes bacterium]|nr:hypothetical protein [Bacteroidota bacterium]